MRKYFLYMIFGLAILASGVACKTTHKVADSPEGGTWMATSMYGESIAEVDFMRGSPSIIFTDSTSFNGSTGCNQYSAKYSEGEFGVKITIGPMTKMACSGDEESIFIKALSETNRMKREGEVLMFFNNEQEVIRFQKVS